ncbi:hypothetical protein A9G34_10255 [Gilliamella sp. Choc4-2]|uniref:hypothetical protein n=1 Tax=unclassified Gilliamella TaxID=2685620 RepID=UPI0004DD8C57|nr:hypothetical protein [Gilliamella apicola]KFA58775.1 hypothetical protein GAPWKB11_1393 [Gilliamella apicola]OCG33098.1 hypothetical protein A9G33_01575 [Gilliamella apicola]OCG42593.1 hypothetical protein A9G34_10255 [Gilliamella apicola]OCG55594.1 hypothetical protein A9G36_04830 [Gilliamella apicola]OCG64185.1 hypothetical protein A9G48_03735 [Gilliamella apicola]
MQKKIPFSLVFTQTCNFFRNRIIPIALVSLLVALMSPVISYYFYKLETYTQLYLSGNIASYVSVIIIEVAIYIAIKSISIATVYNLYVSDKLNPKLLLSKVLENLLKIIVFYFAMIFHLVVIVLFLFLIFITLNSLLPKPLIISLIFITLIIFSVLFFIFTSFFFGLLAESKQKSFSELFSLSCQLTKTQWLPSFLMLLINIAYLMIITKLFMIIGENNIVVNIIFSFCSAFFDIFLTSFFYRLYWLATNDANSNFPTKDDQQ